MMTKTKPNGWQLVALVPLMLGMFILERRIDISPPQWHQVIQAGIVLFIYGGMAIWLRINSPALAEEEYERSKSQSKEPFTE